MERADEGSGLRQRRRLRARLRIGRRAGQCDLRAQFGDAEIEEFHSRLREHDVRGLQVAMRDAGMMRGVERIEDLDADPKRRVERQRPSLQTRGECFAVEIRHHEIRRSLVRADVVQGTDVRMVDSRDDARFAVEALAYAGIDGQRRGQNLDGDGAIQAGVGRLVDLPHPAGANQRHDLVGAETRTRIEGHSAARRIIASRLLRRGPIRLRASWRQRCVAAGVLRWQAVFRPRSPR